VPGPADGRGAVPVHQLLGDTKGHGPGPVSRAAAAAALALPHEHSEVPGSGYGHPPLADAARLAGRVRVLFLYTSISPLVPP
jgi:hypothetical protein